MDGEDQHDATWVNWKNLLDERRDRVGYRLSWLSLRALASSANDLIGKGAPQLVRDLRSRWVQQARRSPSDGLWDADFVVSMPEATGFLVVGDTGEQDASQYAVVPALVAQRDVGFMVICSDVIYPAGDINDYVDGFYRPYERFEPPIFVLPGNHDWYDGLNGFMWHFCDAPTLPVEAYDVSSYEWRARFARLLWRKPAAPRINLLHSWRQGRALTDASADPSSPSAADPAPRAWRPLQPGPYFAIDTPELLVVCIDTGISGELDWEQGNWLARISRERDKDKVLLTGKPLMVDHRHEPCHIAYHPNGKPPAYPTVDAIVRKRAHRYVAAIGGDIHNYQHYPVTLRDTPKGSKQPPPPRQFHYLVSGGGGAFMSATHAIPQGHNVTPDCDDEHSLDEIDVDGFTCYPTREQSLRFYAERLVPLLWKVVLWVAAAIGGVALGAFVVAFGDPGGALSASCAVALLLWLALVWPGIGHFRRTLSGERRRPGSVVAGGLTGAVGTLTGQWLVPAHFTAALAVMVGLAAFGAVVAWCLRATRWWLSSRRAQAAYVIQLLVVLVAVTWLLVVRLDGAGGWLHILITGLGAPVVLVALLLLIDWAQRESKRHYQRAVLVGGVLAVGAVVALGASTDSWIPRAVVTAAVLLATLLLGILIAHLTFLGAFTLLLRPGDRTGQICEQEAREAIKWRANELAVAADSKDPPAERPDGRVRRIVNLVYPGSLYPNGPLQRKVSEICDRDRLPFYKNFLRIDACRGTVTIRAYAVTGQERSLNDVRLADEEVIKIKLPVYMP